MVANLKTNFILISLFLFCGSCDKTEFPDDKFSVKDTKYGECKPDTKAFAEEYLLLSAQENYWLNIDHINAIFNCEPGEIIVEASLEGDTITINQFETQSFVNCICPYDISFTVGPIPYQTYTLVLQRAGFERVRTKFTFSSGFEGRIDITST